MNAGPDIAGAAKLLADPARAAMIGVLLSGGEHSASELAGTASITAPTASAHLALLAAGGFIAARRSGRHVL